MGDHQLRRLRKLGALAGGVLALKIVVQIYLQLRPHITPPAAGFLLHSRLRWRLRDLHRTLAPLQLHDGLQVLEVGGGTGACTVPIAEQIRPDGAVYSIELQRAMLSSQLRRVHASAACNIRLQQADALHLPFAGGSFDRALLVAVLPMLPDKQRALHELRRVLKPGGLLLVSEELIEPEYVPCAVVRRWCRRAGFEELSVDRALWFYTVLCRNPYSSGQRD